MLYEIERFRANQTLRVFDNRCMCDESVELEAWIRNRARRSIQRAAYFWSAYQAYQPYLLYFC